MPSITLSPAKTQELTEAQMKHKYELEKMKTSFLLQYVMGSLSLLIVISILFLNHTATEKVDLIKTVSPIVAFVFGYLFGEARRYKDDK